MDKAVADVLSGLEGKIHGALEDIKRASASLAALAAEMTLDGQAPKGRKPAAGRKKGSGDEMAEAEEAIYATAAAVSKYKCLWECMDCRDLVETGAGEISDQLVEVRRVEPPCGSSLDHCACY